MNKILRCGIFACLALTTCVPALAQTTNTAAGQTLRRVRDNAGAAIELTLDNAGCVTSSRVVSGATGRQR